MLSPELSHPQSKHGILVIVVLAGIFFTLLVLLLRFGSAGRPARRVSVDELYVLSESVSIRTQPSAKASRLDSVERGEKLRLIEDRGAWVRVRTPEGLEGWADRSTLEGPAEHERRRARFASIKKLPSLEGLVERRVPLYAGPGIFYSIVGELTPDSRVKIYTRDHDFYAIDVGDDIAYAEVDAISLSASGSPQLNVAANIPPPGEAEMEPTQEDPRTMPEPPPSPGPIFQPEPEPDRPAVESVVYPAVPPGGTQPQVVRRVMPRYPSEARARGVEGSVLIRAIIRRNGTVDDVQILSDLPNGLGEAAAKAVNRWHFRPATYRGEPIDVYYTVTVNFRLN